MKFIHLWAVVGLIVTKDCCAQTKPHVYTTNEKYLHAVTLLKAGKNFQEAIDTLKECVIAKPKDIDLHLTLGSAFTDRAVLYCLAHSHIPDYEAAKARFPRRLETWKLAQMDQKSSLYGLPQPKPPRLVTKDDHKTIQIDTPAIVQTIKDLFVSAESEFKEAQSLAVSNSEKAKCLYYLAAYSGLKIKDAESIYGRGKEKPEDCWDPMEEAVKLSPVSARYYQFLGDTYVGIGRNTTEPLRFELANQAYRRSLRLKPQVLPLRYHLFYLLQSQLPKEALTVSEELTKLDAANGYSSYLYAAALGRNSLYAEFDERNATFAQKQNARRPEVFWAKHPDQSTKEALTNLAQKVFDQIISCSLAPEFTISKYHVLYPDEMVSVGEVTDYSVTGPKYFINNSTMFSSIIGSSIFLLAQSGNFERAFNMCESLQTAGEKLRGKSFVDENDTNPVLGPISDLGESFTGTALSIRAHLQSINMDEIGAAATRSRLQVASKKMMELMSEIRNSLEDREEF